MKYSFFTLLLAGTILSVGALNAMAQDNTPIDPQVGHEQKLDEAQMREKMKERHQQMSKKLAEDLDLTTEQREKADKIHEDGRKDIEPMVEQMKNIREKMDEKRQLNLEEFKKILTPEQKEKFEKIREEYKKKYVVGPNGHKEMDDRPWSKKKHPQGPKMPVNPKPAQ